ncbi:MAG: LysR family transcriptional regulator [Gemmatimonadales bacterium]
MLRDELSLLGAFLVVAEERSFTRAAKRLGVSTSALSRAIRGLEERVGVRLLARTTRSVSPTEAGAQLIARLRPALGEVQGALELISGLRGRPVGRVRLVASPLALETGLAPKLIRYALEFPDVVLDVTTSEDRIDLVEGGFDAGIHLMEFIEKDMAAVRVSQDLRPVIVGSPSYFESHPKPETPRDLLDHRCVNFRHGSTGIYRWEFEKGRRSLVVGVDGPLVVDDVHLMITAALEGVGLAYADEERVLAHLRTGALVRVLDDWCQPFPGFYLYYPSQRQLPAAITALIETLRV